MKRNREVNGLEQTYRVLLADDEEEIRLVSAAKSNGTVSGSVLQERPVTAGKRWNWRNNLDRMWF